MQEQVSVKCTSQVRKWDVSSAMGPLDTQPWTFHVSPRCPVGRGMKGLGAGMREEKGGWRGLDGSEGGIEGGAGAGGFAKNQFFARNSGIFAAWSANILGGHRV